MEISVREVGAPAKKQCVFVDDTATTLTKIREQFIKDDLDLPESFVFVSRNENEITKQQEERLTLDHVCSKNLAGNAVEAFLVVKAARSDTEDCDISCTSKSYVGKVKTRSQKNKRLVPYYQVQSRPRDVLVIKKADGRKFEIKVKEIESIAHVKSLLEKKTGVPPHRQLLECNGIPLRDSTDIKDIDLINGIDFTEKIDFYIRTLTGQTLPVFRVNVNAKIEEISHFITMREGIPLESQRLLFEKKQVDIDRSRTLLDHGIKHGSNLQLCLKLSGS